MYSRTAVIFGSLLHNNIFMYSIPGQRWYLVLFCITISSCIPGQRWYLVLFCIAISLYIPRQRWYLVLFCIEISLYIPGQRWYLVLFCVAISSCTPGQRWFLFLFYITIFFEHYFFIYRVIISNTFRLRLGNTNYVRFSCNIRFESYKSLNFKQRNEE